MILTDFEKQVQRSYPIPAIRNEFKQNLYSELMQRADKKAKKTVIKWSFRPVWVILFVFIALLCLTTWIIGPQRVYAEFMRLIGYYPGVGFVDAGKVRVLSNGVKQVQEGQELTVTRGIIDEYSTQLWLEFSDEARPVDGAWLESASGERFELRNWSYSPDQPGSHGVKMNFPALPEGITQVMLALPEGWRIPLQWVKGNSGSQPNLVIVSTPQSTLQGATPATAGSPSACASVLQVNFCVKAAVQSGKELQVLLQTESRGTATPGSGYSPSMFDVPGQSANIVLQDQQGRKFSANENFIEAGKDQTTLHFPTAGDVEGPSTLQVPAVLVSVPLSASLTVDLGNHPQTGDKIMLDQTITVSGMSLHFWQAHLEGNRDNNSLMLVVTSDPVAGTAEMRPYLLDIGRPSGIDDLYGAGNNPDGSLFIHIELMQAGGLVSGKLQIPLTSATILVNGPFLLQVDSPTKTSTVPSSTPVVEQSTFVPASTLTPLPMSSYSYSGRPLAPGDLLSVVQANGLSTLYAASAQSNFKPEQVAVLPGNVIQVFPHPDHLGIDYLTGSLNPDSGTYENVQLYTLRFSDAAPRLLVGDFASTAYDFHWSFDGRFLAYLATNPKPGQAYQRFVHLIDLDCRQKGPCQTTIADTGNYDIYGLEWSPLNYQLAMGGSLINSSSGTTDILLLQINSSDLATAFTNLTQSTAIEDLAPAQWSSDGRSLLYACSLPTSDVNEYALCKNDLSAKSDETLIEKLPWNMHSITRVNDQTLADIVSVKEDEKFKIRLFDLATKQDKTLLEWPNSDKQWPTIAVSADGQWLAAVIDHFGGLIVVNVADQSHTLVLSNSTNPEMLTWVK